MLTCQFFLTGQVSDWPTEELAVKSFALSHLLLQKAYQNVTVFTDKPSADLLNEVLGIRYENMIMLSGDNDDPLRVRTCNEIKVQIWNQVDHPFLLVDADVYLWRKRNDKVTENDLFFFCTESGDRACFQEMAWVREKYEAANALFTNMKINIDARSYFNTVNTKICGGNYRIYNSYTKSIQNLFVEEKQSFPAKYINAIERYFILGYLKKLGAEYRTILDFPLNYNSNVYTIFEDIGRKTGVTWVPDELKGKTDIGHFLCLKLHELFPIQANIIDGYYQDNHSRHNSADIPTTLRNPKDSSTEHFPRTKAAILELKCLTESQVSNDVSDFITRTKSIVEEVSENTELLADVLQYELAKFNSCPLTSYFTQQESPLYHYNRYTTVVTGNHQEFLARHLRFNPEALVLRSKYNWAVHDQSIPELYTLKVIYNLCTEAENHYTIFTPPATFLPMEIKLDELDILLIDVFQLSQSIIVGIEKVIERASVNQKDLQRTVGYLIETIKRFIFYGILIPH